MSQIKCPECGYAVSDDEQQCPNCGFPLHSQQNVNCAENSAQRGNLTSTSLNAYDKTGNKDSLYQTSPTRKETHNFYFLYWLILLFILLMGGVGFWLYYNSQKQIEYINEQNNKAQESIHKADSIKFVMAQKEKAHQDSIRKAKIIANSKEIPDYIVGTWYCFAMGFPLGKIEIHEDGSYISYDSDGKMTEGGIRRCDDGFYFEGGVNFYNQDGNTMSSHIDGDHVYYTRHKDGSVDK